MLGARARWALRVIVVASSLFSGMSGARLLGIHHDAVIFLAEQLPGAQRCQHYKFRYHQQGEGQEEPPLNPHGAARAEVYLR